MPLSHLHSCQILSRDSQSDLNEHRMTFYERGFQQDSMNIEVWLRFITQWCKIRGTNSRMRNSAS